MAPNCGREIRQCWNQGYVHRNLVLCMLFSSELRFQSNHRIIEVESVFWIAARKRQTENPDMIIKELEEMRRDVTCI